LADEQGQAGGREVATGFGMGLLLHLSPLALLVVAWVPCALGGEALGVVCAIALGLAFGCWAFIGVAQLVYVIPAIVWARRRGRTGVVKGLVIAAALTFALNSACWGGFLWLTVRG
jgi:hypothetical protein